MLHGRRILVVEDEALTALLVQEAVEDARGTVIGPVRSNREALALLAVEAPDGAILDVNIADGDVTPTARLLIDRGTPLIFFTGGVLPQALRAACARQIVLSKPAGAAVLIEAVHSALTAAKA